MRIFRLMLPFLLFVPLASVQAQDTLLWRHSAAEKISFYRLTALGNLVVGMDAGLFALDPESGEPMWVRDDILELKEAEFDAIPLTSYGVVRSKDGIAVLDLLSGLTMWDSSQIPLKKVRGYYAVLPHNMMLIYGESDESKQTLIAVDLQSGNLRWSQGDLFDKKPKLAKIDGIHTLIGHQPPLQDTDSTMILYISKDGPIRIHVETGEKLWWADALKGKDPPMLSRWYEYLMLVDGVLLVPYEKKLMALDSNTGRVIWDREKKFGSPIAQMELVSQGLVVRGARPMDQEQKLSMPDAFIDLIDLETGESLWPEPFEDTKDESTAPFLVADDTVYIGDKEHFYAISLEDGRYPEPVTYKFEGGEEPAWLDQRGDELLILSEHNLIILDRFGAPKQHTYYPSPGSSLLSQIGKGMLFAASIVSQAAAADAQQHGGVYASFEYNPFIQERIEQSVEVDRFSYIYTKDPGTDGREGFSLVKLRRSDGKEAARIWIDERSPDYVVDEVTSTVFLKRTDREIVALKFPED